MARINLLPWREQLRKERRKQFTFVAGGSAALMLLVIFYVHLHIGSLIQDQQSRNSYMKQQISDVESRIKEIENLEKQKQQLLARMHVIEQLQSNRPEIVHIFYELAKATPDGLYLDRIVQSGRIITLTGRSQSNARVSTFMRNLDSSAWFENPVLDVIESNEKGGNQNKGNSDNSWRKFTLHVTQAEATKGK